MVSLAMSAIGVIVLTMAVDCGHNLHATPAPVIWNLSRKAPDCDAQASTYGEALEGGLCGPSTAARVGPHGPVVGPHGEKIMLCCEGGSSPYRLVCKKGRNEYKCKS